jgi:TusA-related sulfurtransferase
MKKFIRTLKPGDTVDVTYTESVAVSVIPAAAVSQ